MPFELKDIPQLPATTSLSATQKVATAVPTGVGSNHNLNYITKASLLIYDGTSIPTRAAFSGLQRVLNVNGDTSWLEHLSPVNALLYRGAIFGVTPDGSNINVQLTSGGDVICNTLELKNASTFLSVTNGITGTASASFDEEGSIQTNPKTTALTPSTGATINVTAAQWRVVYFELVSTIAALTINMPATPVEGQRVTLYFKQAVTSVTHSGNGENLEGALTTAERGQAKTWIYDQSTSTWIPIVNQAGPRTFVFAPLTGDTIEVSPTNHSICLIEPAGSIAALTINMPLGYMDGQKVSFYFTATVSAITLVGASGATFLAALTSASNGNRITYAYFQTQNEWVPIS